MTELEPPWSRFPEIPQGSIGWRMGGGEDHIFRWFAFAREHWTSRAVALAYLRRHPAAPPRWANFIVDRLLEADERAGIPPTTGIAGQALREVLRTMLESDGLIGDDVAYPAFVRNQLSDRDLPPPWHGFLSDRTLDDALRYSAREVGWWARWLDAECKDQHGYFVRHPPAPHWQPVLDELLAGRSSAWQSLHGGAAGLLSAAVLHGLMPPPWSSGDHPALDRATNWEPKEADDRDRWLWWVTRTFDDPGSWLAYLERWPPPPPWRAYIDERLRGLSSRRSLPID